LPVPAIAFDLTPLQNAHRYRGIGTYVRGLAARLAGQSEIPLEFWAMPGEVPLDVASPHRLVRLRKVPSPQYRGAWLFQQLTMRLSARASSVRAIHITDPEALTRLGSRALFTTVYDLIPLKEGINPRRLIAWTGYRSYLRALRRADLLFAISNHTASDLEKILGSPADRIVVAAPGIDLAPSTTEPAPASPPYFLFLGGPNPNKNLGVLLDAFVMCAELPEELRVAGRWLPRQVAALETMIQAKGLTGRVRHVGFVATEELPGLMRNATALVVPSLDEGFGLPVGEGLAAGAVVIHSQIPVLDETSAGSALTFDPHSPSDLAACLRRASSDSALRRDLRARGRQRARELTWDGAVTRTIDAYRRFLKA
jgi:glycosyltransferase involved in cell wall biosynthesis